MVGVGEDPLGLPVLDRVALALVAVQRERGAALVGGDLVRAGGDGRTVELPFAAGALGEGDERGLATTLPKSAKGFFSWKTIVRASGVLIVGRSPEAYGPR
ncbi:hypothetical protein [Streptomyces sp. RTd22]|uniref:hypothetical protein n=1 Tax=Streptomyces sp. RTd22 TaxID=1841249 RepID=UPI0007D9CD98|nr:hypothetical protein [Streptomyces sp. RTd22]